MDFTKVMRLIDSSYRTRQTIEKALRDIDRRALNAMVLVKRHGEALAGYGVIATAFRERAATLKHSASHLQSSISPLVQTYMRMLQLQHHRDSLDSMQATLCKDASTHRSTHTILQHWQQLFTDDDHQAQNFLRSIINDVATLQEGVNEQEYVVTNGRIEAALSEATGAPLMRVSQDMGNAVAAIRTAIWAYRQQLEELLYEGSTGI